METLSSPKRRRKDEQPKESSASVILPDYKLPEVLIPHFVYAGTVADGPSRRNILQCLHCTNKIKGKANDVFSFRRHLTSVHGIAAEKKKAEPQSSTLLQHFTFPKKPVSTIPTQKWFREAVLDLVAIDGLPLSVMEGVGFQNFVGKLNPSVRCYSSRTIVRHLDEDFHKVVLPSLTRHLQDLPPNSLHVTLDLWSSRLKDSIMGINVSYISSSWKFHHRCLAFEKFPECHTGKNIECRVRATLERRKIKMRQVGKVMADNASNMIAAFNLTTVLRGNWKPVSPSTDDDEVSGDDEICSDEDDEDLVDESDNDSNDIQFSWKRLGCCAHKLQLCVRAAIQDDASAKHVIEQVNQMTLLFRRSNKLTHKLKELTKSRRGLLLPGSTRWNSVFHAIKRVLKDDVFKAVIEVIGSRSTSFTEAIKPQLEELIKLLEPMNIATNRLQANGVTSSLVIPSLLEAYIGIQKAKCNYFPVLKDVLLKQMKQRFLSTLSEPTYIISTILDPRMKSRIFKASLSPEFSPVSEEIAFGIINQAYNETRSDEPVIIPAAESSIDLQKTTNKPKDIFSFLDSVAPLIPVQKTELELYLQEAILAKENDPLMFWKENTSRFPALSTLARINLAIPASSGDVERLFSIAGSIQRARRSSITSSRLEQLLLYRDYRLPLIS